MEMNQFDVVVVSAFGRGHWLAAEFAREKLHVLLVDVTSRLGQWPVEDGEGPFGVVRVDRFEESFLERLNNDDPIENCENGWTLWLKNGPLEFKGPFTRFHAEKMKWPSSWLESFSKGDAINVGTDPSFLENWPVALAHQLAATSYRPAAGALAGGRALPFAASFGVKLASRQGLARNLEWLREKGVTVTDKAEILDLSLKKNREMSGLELKGNPNGLVRADLFVWTLTGGETKYLSKKLADLLYPGSIAAPTWCWVRYRLSVQEAPEMRRLPLHSVVIGDIEYPWTHENVIILVKTLGEGRVDAWIRIPTGQRFNKEYLEEQGRRIVEQLKKRMPTAGPEVQSLPQEASYNAQDLGEPRVPLWEAGSAPWKGRAPMSNLFFESPENRENHTLDSEFDHQRALRDRAMRWWQQRRQKQQKERERSD